MIHLLPIPAHRSRWQTRMRGMVPPAVDATAKEASRRRFDPHSG